MDLARFPRHPLTFGPTPLEPLPRLSAYLGGKVEIWAKREDCNSGLAFGGNKIRKLEYLVPDILAQGCDTLVSIGGVQSNHTRQVAAVAAKLGLKCHLIQGSWVDWPDGAYDRVGNIQLSRILGAAIEFSHEDFSIALKESWAKGVEAVRRAGGKPYGIPAGASDHPLGGLGYVGFAEELRAQERDLGFPFRYHSHGIGLRQHPGRHGGGLRRGGPGEPGHRHRHHRQARRHPGHGEEDRRPDRREARA